MEKLENRFIITYDIKQKLLINVIFQMGDINSSVLEIHLLDNGAVVDVSGETIEFRFIKNDGTIIYQDITTNVTILDSINGIVECKLMADTLAIAGIVKCEIHRTIGTTQLTLPAFNFTVKNSIGANGILSQNYISSIETELSNITAAENIRIDNENTRISNETNRENILNNNITTVLAVNNIYTLDFANVSTKNYIIETLDTNAKAILLTNIPENMLAQLTVKLKYTNACIITHPPGISWLNSVVPVFLVGATYFILYVSDDGGATWLATSIANSDYPIIDIFEEVF